MRTVVGARGISVRPSYCVQTLYWVSEGTSVWAGVPCHLRASAHTMPGRPCCEHHPDLTDEESAAQRSHVTCLGASPSCGGPTPLWTGRQGRTNNSVMICLRSWRPLVLTCGHTSHHLGSSNNYGCLCLPPRDWPCRLRCGQGAGALRAPV